MSDTQPPKPDSSAPPAGAPFVGPGPDLLTDHAYDGIQEYDNPMPGWWKWLFVATIAFSLVYVTVDVVSGGRHAPVVAYEQARELELRLQNAKPLRDDVNSLLGYIHDDKVRSAGAAIFAANCALCHKPNGSGQVGPNMTDDVYINIRTIDDIPRLIRSGAKNGAMPSFARMPPNDIIRVAAFVASLRGTNVPGGKPMEGVAIPPWGSTAPMTMPSTTRPATTRPATLAATLPTTVPAK
ncbi:cbb3-type cytochrome c oxidase N-terminal domain-containing protein [Humisphaera borealis]|uniref:C-type cytochrome n=1 Tax=Humisphaera borealis TaxID=2807512 RepID=A0A7M2WSG7_9BACT|nr:cbb3-type cytochrome c oxidase N-terminal domain-containing protein [Humisphaera borealis]QOV88406.1 c-type cytochrome [Humisphaera borealis]